MTLTTDARLLIARIVDDATGDIRVWKNPALVALADALQDAGDPRGEALSLAISWGFRGSPDGKLSFRAGIVYPDRSEVKSYLSAHRATFGVGLLFRAPEYAPLNLFMPSTGDVWERMVSHRFALCRQPTENPT